MFEQNLQRSMFSTNNEKTFVDKILARQDVEAIRQLIKKKHLTREEMLEILYLVSGTEAKLLNYSDWDRYVILKFFVWLREFIKVAEILYDYTDFLELKSKECKKCGKIIGSTKKTEGCKCEQPKQEFALTKRNRDLIDNIQRMMEHNAKFLIDLYLNIGRTSLSVGATGMLEILKNKYEIAYPNTPNATQMQGGALSILKR